MRSNRGSYVRSTPADALGLRTRTVVQSHLRDRIRVVVVRRIAALLARMAACRTRFHHQPRRSTVSEPPQP
jgi:hypothetical protein